jgi:hypothetical protein
MKKYLKTIFLIMVILLNLLFGLIALAVCPNCGGNSEVCNNCSDNCQQPCTGQLENPLGSTASTPQLLYGRIIYGFLGVTGALALIMFIVGGFQWMTASGNAERVKKGRDTLMWAVLGLLVIFSSYAILRAVFEALQF